MLKLKSIDILPHQFLGLSAVNVPKGERSLPRSPESAAVADQDYGRVKVEGGGGGGKLRRGEQATIVSYLK
jgi:hypothetical protein